MTDNQQLDEILENYRNFWIDPRAKIANSTQTKQALLQWRDAEVARRCREARKDELYDYGQRRGEERAYFDRRLAALQAEEK